MFTDNIGLELLAATPFTHTISLEGDLAGLGSLATAKHLPPTISLQYFFNNDSNFTPYIGAGVNYTMMLETEITSNGEAVLGSLGITDTSIDADDSVGLSLQAGLDMALTDNIILGAAVWYMDIETEIEVANAVKVDLDIDPWVYMVSVGYKF
jgi:outer membrane protein